MTGLVAAPLPDQGWDGKKRTGSPGPTTAHTAMAVPGSHGCADRAGQWASAGAKVLHFRSAVFDVDLIDRGSEGDCSASPDARALRRGSWAVLGTGIDLIAP